MCERKPCKTLSQLKKTIHKVFPIVNHNLLAEIVLDYLRGGDAQLLRDYLAPYALRCEFYTESDAPVSVHILTYNTEFSAIAKVIGDQQASLLNENSLHNLCKALHSTPDSLYIKFDADYQLQFEVVK